MSPCYNVNVTGNVYIRRFPMSIQTIRDIAEIAGVSVATVSRVMNNKPDVNPETRKKVESVILQHRFVGNRNARELKQNDRSAIAILIHGRSNPFLYALSERILSMTDALPCGTVTEYVDEKDNELDIALDLLHRKDLKGIIFVGSHIDSFSEPYHGFDLPIVFATVSARDAGLPYASSVCIDDRKMARDAVRVLLENGHRDIAVFGASPVGSGLFSSRFRGVTDAFAEYGLQFSMDCFRECRFSVHDGYETALAYFRENPDTTALFAMSDSIAIGAMRALHDLGLSVPEDVSVFGFDGVEMCNYTVPRLSTVIQPVGRIAEETVAMMASMINDNSAPRHIVTEAQLSVNESVQKRSGHL